MNWGDFGLTLLLGISIGVFFASQFSFISILMIALFGILLLWWVETHPHYQPQPEKFED